MRYDTTISNPPPLPPNVRTIIKQRVVNGDPIPLVWTWAFANRHVLVLRAICEGDNRTPALDPLRLGRGGVRVQRESSD